MQYFVTAHPSRSCSDVIGLTRGTLGRQVGNVLTSDGVDRDAPRAHPHTLVLAQPSQLALVPFDFKTQTLDLRNEKVIDFHGDIIALAPFRPPFTAFENIRHSSFRQSEEGILVLTSEFSLHILAVNRSDSQMLTGLAQIKLADPCYTSTDARPCIRVDRQCRVIACWIYEGGLQVIHVTSRVDATLGVMFNAHPVMMRSPDLRLVDFGFLNLPMEEDFPPNYFDDDKDEIAYINEMSEGDGSLALSFQRKDILSLLKHPPILVMLTEDVEPRPPRASRKSINCYVVDKTEADLSKSQPVWHAKPVVVAAEVTKLLLPSPFNDPLVHEDGVKGSMYPANYALDMMLVVAIGGSRVVLVDLVQSWLSFQRRRVDFDKHTTRHTGVLPSGFTAVKVSTAIPMDNGVWLIGTPFGYVFQVTVGTPQVNPSKFAVKLEGLPVPSTSASLMAAGDAEWDDRFLDEPLTPSNSASVVDKDSTSAECVRLPRSVSSRFSPASGLLYIPPLPEERKHGFRMFVASSVSHSQLVLIKPSEVQPKDIQLASAEIVQRYEHMGPMLDAMVADAEGTGSLQLVVGTGVGRDGAVRVLQRSMGMYTVANVSIPGITDMFTLPVDTSGSGSAENFIFASAAASRTFVLRVTVDKSSESDHGTVNLDLVPPEATNHITNEMSLLVAPVPGTAGKSIVQVTPTQIQVLAFTEGGHMKCLCRLLPVGTVRLAAMSSLGLVVSTAEGAIHFYSPSAMEANPCHAMLTHRHVLPVTEGGGIACLHVNGDIMAFVCWEKTTVHVLRIDTITGFHHVFQPCPLVPPYHELHLANETHQPEITARVKQEMKDLLQCRKPGKDFWSSDADMGPEKMEPLTIASIRVMRDLSGIPDNNFIFLGTSTGFLLHCFFGRWDSGEDSDTVMATDETFRKKTPCDASDVDEFSKNTCKLSKDSMSAFSETAVSEKNLHRIAKTPPAADKSPEEESLPFLPQIIHSRLGFVPLLLSETTTTREVQTGLQAEEEMLLVAGNRPYLIHSTRRGRLSFVSLLATSVMTVVTPVKICPSVFALVWYSNNALLSVSVLEPMERTRISSLPIGSTPDKVAFHRPSGSVLVGCVRERSRTTAEDSAMDGSAISPHGLLAVNFQSRRLLATFPLGPRELPSALLTLKAKGPTSDAENPASDREKCKEKTKLVETEMVVMGTILLNEGNHPSEGALRLLSLGPQPNGGYRFSLVDIVKVNRPVYALAVDDKGNIIVGMGSEVRVFNPCGFECIMVSRSHTQVLAMDYFDGQLAVGDLLRSVSLCLFSPARPTRDTYSIILNEVARDANSLCVLSAAFASEDILAVSDDTRNIFCLRSQHRLEKRAEDKMRLKTVGMFHAGVQVNTIVPFEDEDCPLASYIYDEMAPRAQQDKNISTCLWPNDVCYPGIVVAKRRCAWVSSEGSCGYLLTLPRETDAMQLVVVQESMEKVFPALSGISRREWRGPMSNMAKLSQHGIIDGDYIEQLLTKTRKEQEKVWKHVRESKNNSFENLDDLLGELETLRHAHIH